MFEWIHKNWIHIIIVVVICIVLGFFSDIHAMQCSLPDLELPSDGSYCPSSCECFRSTEKCQIPACDDLDYWHWWGIRYFKWR